MARRRYHQSAKDRLDEARGMRRRDHRLAKDRLDEERGMRRRDHRLAKDRLDESRGMEKKLHRRDHQSARDRLDESRGMEREIRRKDLLKERERLRNKHHSSHSNKKGMHKDPYAGMDSRRRHEMEDAGLIREDHFAVANLPQHVIMREYPKTDYFNYNLNDDIRGIDYQIDDDVRAESRGSKAHHKYPEKY